MRIFESINKGFESKYGDLDGKKENKVTECDKVTVKKESCNNRVAGCTDTRFRGKKKIKEYKDMGQDLSEYQKWVDYDMKRYHKISDKTMGEIKKAGLSVVKDQYGDYEVIAKEPVRESLKLIMDIGDYRPWSGAVDTFYKIQDAGMVGALEDYLEDIYPEGLTVTELNDILWFDGESVLSDLGISDEEDDEDEEEDEDEEDEEDIDESCKKSVKEGKSIDIKKLRGQKK